MRESDESRAVGAHGVEGGGVYDKVCVADEESPGVGHGPTLDWSEGVSGYVPCC